MSKRSSLYRDPRWQRKRLEIMQRDGFKCVACGNSDETLNVHHGRYDYENGQYKPWITQDEYLQTLCEPCHMALGSHPKAGVMYRKEDVHGIGVDYLVVAYSHCPSCGCKQTNCHSACVLFACKCDSPWVPECLSNRFEFQSKNALGEECYYFWPERGDA